MTEKLNNWPMFLNYIVEMFNDEKSELDISLEMREKNILWEGRIADIRLDEEYSPGIAVTMEPKTLPMSKGKILRADYLFLNIEKNEKSAGWKNCKIGDKVKFRGTISKSTGPFPEIQLSQDEIDPEVLLMIGLYKCDLLSVSKV